MSIFGKFFKGEFGKMDPQSNEKKKKLFVPVKGENDKTGEKSTFDEDFETKIQTNRLNLEGQNAPLEIKESANDDEEGGEVV